jgi:hypothetical protein
MKLSHKFNYVETNHYYHHLFELCAVTKFYQIKKLHLIVNIDGY